MIDRMFPQRYFVPHDSHGSSGRSSTHPWESEQKAPTRLRRGGIQFRSLLLATPFGIFVGQPGWGLDRELGMKWQQKHLWHPSPKRKKATKKWNIF